MNKWFVLIFLLLVMHIEYVNGNFDTSVFVLLSGLWYFGVDVFFDAINDDPK